MYINVFELECVWNTNIDKQNAFVIVLFKKKKLNSYRILQTIGRYFFSSTRWLRPIVHIDLYKDEVKKIWNP
jgi:hypothetical protein